MTTVTPTKRSIDVLAQQLRDVGYFTGNKHLLATTWQLFQEAKYPRQSLPGMVLHGDPGTGKTFLAKCAAHIWKSPMGEPATFIDLQFTVGIGREALMDDLNIGKIVSHQANHQPLDPEEVYIDGILVQALKSSHDRRTVLLLDEMDKAKPSVDSMMLQMMQDGYISLPHRGRIEAKRGNLIVFATMNSERQLSDALMRRFWPITLTWPIPELEWKLIRMQTRNWVLEHFARRDGDRWAFDVNEDSTRMRRYRDGAPEGLCKALVSYANRIRAQKEKAQLMKVPSTPELVNAAIAMLLGHKEMRGFLAASCLFKYPDDRAALVQNRSFVEDDDSLLATFAAFD